MKVLALFAHIEDHICFGWPLMQGDEVEKYLVICTNDGNGTLQKSCEDANIHLVATAELPRGFYRQRAGELGMVANYLSQELGRIIKNIKPDFLFTHNPWGEYGHCDHRLVFEVVYGFPVPILITDIIADSVCFPRPKREIYAALYTEPYATVKSNRDFYSRQADIFKDASLWTTNQHLDKPYYPPETATLYEVDNEK